MVGWCIELEAGMTRRLNQYTCDRRCGLSLLSEDVDEGVTPFQLPCVCGGNLVSHFYHVQPEVVDKPADIEWYKPTSKQLKRMSNELLLHVTQGGLALRIVSDSAAHLWRLA